VLVLGCHTGEWVVGVDQTPIVVRVAVVVEGIEMLEGVSVVEVQPLAFATIKVLFLIRSVK